MLNKFDDVVFSIDSAVKEAKEELYIRFNNIEDPVKSLCGVYRTISGPVRVTVYKDIAKVYVYTGLRYIYQIHPDDTHMFQLTGNIKVKLIKL